MDWAALLRLPTTLLAILAVVALLATLAQLVALRERLHAGRHAAAAWRGLTALVALLLTLVLALGALMLRGYRLLDEEAPVVTIDARILSPQRWELTLRWPDGSSRELQLDGDDWRLEAVVLKWGTPALLAGLPPLYRLDRLSGRYDDAAQEASAPRTVIDFAKAGELDPLDLHRSHPDWLPGVDVVYGSGTYLPLVDQGHYTVSLMRSGALVARPDDATAQRMGQPLEN